MKNKELEQEENRRDVASLLELIDHVGWENIPEIMQDNIRNIIIDDGSQDDFAKFVEYMSRARRKAS